MKPKTPKPLVTRTSFFIAGVFFILLIPYLFKGTLQNGFVNYDDPAFIEKNIMIHKLDADHIRQMFQSLHTANWHPLTWISHAVDYHFYGLDPRGHHLTNILLHGANAFLVFCFFFYCFKFIRNTLFPSHNVLQFRLGGLYCLASIRCGWSPWLGLPKEKICCALFLS